MTNARIIATDAKSIVLDLSSGAKLQGQPVAGNDVVTLSTMIESTMREAGTGFAFGRYGEPRDLYHNRNFAEADTRETRTIHLGIDVFCAVETPVYAPLDGRVEIVTNNDKELDYGPMMVLRHEVPHEDPFFTLYGHLSMDTLQRVSPGQIVAAGEQIASVGEPPTNGNWPPHLHLQEIKDLLGLGAEFPGVALKSQQKYWFGVSPSPARYFSEINDKLLDYA